MDPPALFSHQCNYRINYTDSSIGIFIKFLQYVPTKGFGYERGGHILDVIYKTAPDSIYPKISKINKKIS